MADGKLYWYVLFARTGTEERLVEKLKDLLGSEGYRPFVPQKTCVFRRQGQKSLFQKPCFPGYVFIESDKSAAEFIEHAYPIIYKLKEAYRFLCYGDKTDIAMRDEERVVLKNVLGDDYRIDISTGYKEGEFVKIISGPLVGKESRIVSINRGRREAIVEVELFGNTVQVSVGLEMIEKKPEALLHGKTNAVQDKSDFV